MRACRVPLALAAVVVCAACADATGPSLAGPLLGRWSTDRTTLRPAGSHQYHLTFDRNGRFSAEVRSYGLYPGQRADDVSAYVRTVGTFALVGDRVTLTPESTVTWDRFYGADSPPTVQTPSPHSGGSYYDDARFRLDGDTLTLDYTSYPADAPVPSRQVFRRDRQARVQGPH